MKSYTVIWDPDAKQDLASRWLDALDRKAVTQAANRIDRTLQSQPREAGFPIVEGLRGLIDGPLRVLYSIREDDKIVEVHSVKSAGG